MRKIILYIAASLDGYIADKDHGLDWLTVYHGNYGYGEFLTSVDTAISGRTTYDMVVKMGVADPYPELEYYILTHSPEQFTSTEKRIYTAQDPVELVNDLKKKNGKDIFLVGGGKTIGDFLEHGLIDNIILFIVPIILGNGIPLFNKISHSVSFKTESTKKHDDGMMEIRLDKK